MFPIKSSSTDRPRITGAILLLSVAMLIQCEPAPTPVANFECTSYLTNHDLPALKSCIEGAWKIEYQKWQTKKEVIPDSYVVITDTDSIFYYWVGLSFAESPITWHADPMPGFTFSNLHGQDLSWEVQNITRDTLLVSHSGALLALSHLPRPPETDCANGLAKIGLRQFKSCILGKWQLRYRSASIADAEKYYYTDEVLMNFLSGDSIYYTVNGVSLAKSKVEWQYGTTPGDDIFYLLRYTTLTGETKTYGVGGIYSDTLTLVDDGYRYSFSRKK